jgi:Flp pilus assembly protein TadD
VVGGLVLAGGVTGLLWAAHDRSVAGSADAGPVAVALDALPARSKARSLLSRAEALVDGGHAKEAVPVLEQAVRFDPGNADAWRTLGIARATIHDDEGARTAYRAYIESAPDAPDAPDVRHMLGE